MHDSKQKKNYCRIKFNRPYKAWAGEDCSYLFPYAAGFRSASVNWLLMIVLGVFVTLAVGIGNYQDLLDGCERAPEERCGRQQHGKGGDTAIILSYNNCRLKS
jgi:hypothetical protein